MNGKFGLVTNFVIILCVVSGIGLLAINGATAEEATEVVGDDESEVSSSSSAEIDIIDESPARNQALDPGDTVTFDLDITYDTGGEAPDRLSVRINEDGSGGGAPVKERSLSATSGSETITVTETVDSSWESLVVVVNLWGEDSFGSLATTEIVYGVGDNTPIADFDCVATQVSEGDTIFCDSMSVAPGGNIISYDWTTSGFDVVADYDDSVDLEAQQPGDHTIELTITDDNGRTDSSEVVG